VLTARHGRKTNSTTFQIIMKNRSNASLIYELIFKLNHIFQMDFYCIIFIHDWTLNIFYIENLHIKTQMFSLFSNQISSKQIDSCQSLKLKRDNMKYR